LLPMVRSASGLAEPSGSVSREASAEVLERRAESSGRSEDPVTGLPSESSTKRWRWPRARTQVQVKRQHQERMALVSRAHGEAWRPGGAQREEGSDRRLRLTTALTTRVPARNKASKSRAAAVATGYPRGCLASGRHLNDKGEAPPEEGGWLCGGRNP